MNHWQTIEDALLYARHIGEVYDRDTIERGERIDAALAFVREMRQGEWEPVPDGMHDGYELHDNQLTTWFNEKMGTRVTLPKGTQLYRRKDAPKEDDR